MTTTAIDEAAFDMGRLGSDFLLFRELASGSDALLERAPERFPNLGRRTPRTSSMARFAARKCQPLGEPFQIYLLQVLQI